MNVTRHQDFCESVKADESKDRLFPLNNFLTLAPNMKSLPTPKSFVNIPDLELPAPSDYGSEQMVCYLTFSPASSADDSNLPSGRPSFFLLLSLHT